MQAKYSRLTVASVCFFIAACGGSGSSKLSILADDIPSTGYLLGPRISGLAYGVSATGSSGKFTLSGGQQLDFKLGDLAIAQVMPRARLSLYDTVGTAEQYRYNKAVRVAQLLISIDGDSDARNGVQLSLDTSTAARAGEIDWQAAGASWSAAAESTVYRITHGSQSLIDAEAAMSVMASHLRAETEVCATDLRASTGFAIADPQCSDKARRKIWREQMSVALNQLQDGIDAMLDGRSTVQAWWSTVERQWGTLLSQAEETQAWLSYAIAGADVPTRQAIASALASPDHGAAQDALQAELERWRSGGGSALRQRDQQERELSAKVIDTWLSYGFDQQSLRGSYGLTDSSDWQDFVRAVAAREGIALLDQRLSVVDEQSYLALQLLDALMNARAEWVAQSDLAGDGTGGDGGTSGQSSDPARVWRVSYASLAVGVLAQFSVEGSDLDSDVVLVLSGCGNMQALGGSADARSFSCELSGNAGGRTLQAIDNSDGSLLYEAMVSIGSGSVTGGDDPVVSSVSPLRADRSSSQLFQVMGQNFPMDLQFSLAGCTSAQVQSRSSTQLNVLCQLDDRAIVRSGEILSNGGTSIYQFNVSPTQISEQLITVTDLAPAAALETETVQMTVSGSGFSASVNVQSAACESVFVVSRTDTQIVFNCVNALVGTWPLYLVTSQQTVVSPVSIQVRANEGVVTSVTPLSGAVGEWVNIKVAGQHLSTGVRIVMDACSSIEVLDGSSVLRQFGCTLGTSGSFQGQVLAGEQVLHSFAFTVDSASDAQVNSVSPSSSNYGEALALVFSGSDLPELAQMEMNNCSSIAQLSAISTQLVYSCTPQQIGRLSGRLLDVGGQVLTTFVVDVIDATDPLEGLEIESVVPEVTYVDAETTFTVSGENLPSTMIISVDECTEVVALGGHDRQRQYRCTPRGSSGIRSIRVYASDGGVLLGTFDLQVTGDEMRVSDITPAQTALGVLTYFRVSGQNLSSAMIMDIDGCDARLTSSTSTEMRTYRCAPYGLAGSRVVNIKDRLGGTVLFSKTIAILPAP